MANLSFQIDSSQLAGLNTSLARIADQFEWITARAMTNAAKASKFAIAQEILPMVKGGATAWTRRALIVKYASRNDLTAMAGFQYGEGKFTDSEFTRKAGGIPAGRYMGINARGGDRRPKASEMQLRRAGLIRPDQFITPAKGGIRLNQHGNVSASTYQQMISRLRGFSIAGSNQNAVRGGRRRPTDYFIMRRDSQGYTRNQLGAEPVFIAKRAGRGGRGFKPAFFITDQPNYERRFPIQSVALREYQRVFPQEFNAGIRRELARRSSR